MSESDSANKASALKLNAAASEFVPGSYASKPAAAKTTAPATNNQAPKGNTYNNNRAQGQNNYNNRGPRPNNNMVQQPYYNAPQIVTPEQEMYIYQMQMMAANQGILFDPIFGWYAYINGVAVSVPPPMMPQEFIPYVPAEGEQTEAFVAEEGEVVEGQEAAEAVTEATSEEATTSAVEEPVAAAPAPAATGKYVPPNRSAAPATTAAPVSGVEALTQKAAALSISTEDEVDTPVDIEATTGESLRYPKQAILALFNSEGVTIPATLREFFTAENFELGSKDGSKFVRQPLPSVVQLAESGAAFYGGGQTPGRGKGSSNNLRGGASSSNLERSASSSSFGGHNNNRRNNNRDRDNREAGELVEGDEGFVPYDESNPAPEETRRESRKKNKNQNLPPAVYKSRFQLDASDPMAIVRKANAILNKLSITNFDKLSDEFLLLLQTDATTEDAMRRGVEALVTKAQMEENFCFIYADLCRKIIDTWSALEPDDNTFSTAAEEGEDGEAAPAPAEGEEAKQKELRTMGKIFKETLLQRCQSEFEFDHIAVLKEIRENTELQPDERTEKEILLKKRITGHMRFIGELYMKDLIKANVIKACCLDVLIESVLEEELVCLCKLFQTIGARLEKYFQDKSRQKKNKSKNLQDIIPQYFERILAIGQTHPSSRVRFMMKDLADMRANDWTARREEEKMVNLDKKAEVQQETQFKPVATPYISGDARNVSNAAAAVEPVVDEWSVVAGTGKKGKPSAPSPVPSAAPLSRVNSNAQISRVNSTSNGNLSGLDKRRPGPGAPAAAGGPGAGPRKDKPASRDNNRDSRAPAKDNKGPRAGPNRGNSVSPVPSEPVESAPVVVFTSDLPTITKKVRSAAKEYYRNGLVEEATLTFQEVNPLPTLVADVVKDLISQCVELSSEKDCVALVALLAALRTVFVAGSAAPVLSVEQVKEGVLKFLHVVDELSIDVPKAGSLGAAIIGHLVAQELLSLEVFASVPDDNDFSFSSRFADTVLLAVKEVAAKVGAEAATAQFKAAGLDLVKTINAPPKQSAEEALAELAVKHEVAFLLA